MGILSAAIFLLSIGAIIGFFKTKGIFEMIFMLLFFACVIALPFFTSRYFFLLFQAKQTDPSVQNPWSLYFGLSLGLALSFALCGVFTYRLRINWIKTLILALFLICGVATIITGVYLSKYYFVGDVSAKVFSLLR